MYDRLASDTVRVNKGPLTTTFTPPASCETAIRTSTGWLSPELEQGCQGPGGNECCPDGWQENVYFSPGVCPSGYSACTMPTTRQRVETTNLCCPSNYICATAPSYDYCTSAINNPLTYTNTLDDGTTRTGSKTTARATPIQIRFQETDSSVVPIPTDSFKLLGPGELTTAGKVGVGIGVPFGALVLAGLAFCWCARKHRAGSRGRTGDSHALLLDQDLAQDDDESPPPYERAASKR